MAAPAAVLSILVNANTTQASSQLARFQGQLQATERTAQRSTAATAASIGRGAARAATAVGLIGVGSIVAAAKFEDAFADVRKTVDATEPEFDRIEKGIRNMAKAIPVSVTELSHLAGQAGALGVKADDLVRFTRVAADLGIATDLSADQAATALARLAKVMEEKGEKAFSRMGATLVDLGNKGASTESEITEMALRISGAGKTVGLSTQGVLGLAAALSNVGIRAEAGGSAVSRVMLTMQDAIAKGRGEVEKFASIAGVSAERFEEMFAKDPSQAIAVFAAGLDRLNKSGASTVEVLDGVELNEIRVRDTLLRLAGATGEVSRAQDIANKAWGENSALAEEANKRYATTASQFEVLKNRVFDLGIAFGQDLLPKVNEAMKALGEGNLGGAIQIFAGIGADMAVKLIGAFVKAWWDSNLLGKLFMTGAFIRLVGGRGVFGKLGWAIAEPLMNKIGAGISRGANKVKGPIRRALTASGTAARAGATAAAEWIGSTVASIRSSKLAAKLRGFFRRVAIQMGKVLAATTAAAVVLGEGIGGAASGLVGLLRQRLPGKMSRVGKIAGKAFGVAFIAGFVLALPEISKRLQDKLGFGKDDSNLLETITGADPFEGVRDKLGLGGARGGVVTPKGIVPLQGFARGGRVQGVGPTDTVPAMLTPGEVVLPVPKAKKAAKDGLSLEGGMGRKMLEKSKKVAKDTAKAIGDELGKGNKRAMDDTKDFVKKHGDGMDKLKDVAKKNTDKFRKGTIDDFHKTNTETTQTTTKMRSNVTERFNQIRGNATEQSGKMKTGVVGDYRSMASATGQAIKKVETLTNKALKTLGVKPVHFGVVEDKKGNGKQRGGHITSPGAPAFGDHIPAMLEKNEYVVNSKATKKHRALLDKINFHDSPRFQTGGVVDRLGVSHFQTGGMQAAASSLARKFVDSFGGSISSGLRPGDDGFHGRGMAFDWVGGDWDAASRYANQIGQQLLEGIHQAPPGQNVSWDSGNQVSPSFWGGATWAGHVDHIHIAVGNMVKGAVGAAVEKIQRIMLEGAQGPLLDIGQASVDKVRAAANSYIEKKTPEMSTDLGVSVATGPIVEMAKAMVEKIWGASQWSPFVSLEMAEAGWDPFATNASSGAYGLAQALPPSKYPPAARPGANVPKLEHAKAQLQWMMSYIQDRYGNPAGAWAWHQSHNWYQRGGEVVPYVGKFHQGGPVMQDGMGLLERGETVIPKMAKGGKVKEPKIKPPNFDVLPWLNEFLHNTIGLPSASWGKHAKHRFHALHAIKDRTDEQQKRLEQLRERRKAAKTQQRQLGNIAAHGGQNQLQNAIDLIKEFGVKFGKGAEKRLKVLEKQAKGLTPHQRNRLKHDREVLRKLKKMGEKGDLSSDQKKRAKHLSDQVEKLVNQGHLTKAERREMHKLQRRQKRNVAEENHEKALRERIALEKVLIEQNKELVKETKAQRLELEAIHANFANALPRVPGWVSAEIGARGVQKRRQGPGTAVRY